MDAGAGNLALGKSSSAAGTISFGAGVAKNTIDNTIRSYVDSSTVNSLGAMSVTARDTSTIDAVAIGGAISVSISGGASGSGAGAGASIDNTITNGIESFIQNGSTIVTGGNLSLKAENTASITSRSIGGSLSVAKAAGASGAVSIGTAIVNNNLGTDSKRHSVRAYIGADGNVYDTTRVNTTGNVSLTANSNPNLDTIAVAASAAIAASAVGAAFSGAGGSINNNLKTTTATIIQNNPITPLGDTIIATGAVTLNATETPTITSKMGAGLAVVGLVGGSIGVSQIRTTIDSDINSFIDGVNVKSNSGLSQVNAISNATVNDLSVATSIAVSVGGAGAGADAKAVTNARVNAYIADDATFNGNSLEVKAISNENLKTEVYGISARISHKLI